MVAPATINSLAEPKYRKRPKAVLTHSSKDFHLPSSSNRLPILAQKKTNFQDMVRI